MDVCKFQVLQFILSSVIVTQSEDPAVQWQLNLYRDVVVKSEEAADPEHTVDRVQSISAAVFHLEQVTQINNSLQNIEAETCTLTPAKIWCV